MRKLLKNVATLMVITSMITFNLDVTGIAAGKSSELVVESDASVSFVMENAGSSEGEATDNLNNIEKSSVEISSSVPVSKDNTSCNRINDEENSSKVVENTVTASTGLLLEEQTQEILMKNNESIELYAINSYYDTLKIPSNYKQKYQIDLSDKGTVTYSIVSGESVTISPKGLIKPAYTIWYWNGNVGSTSSSGAEDETKTIEYEYGTSIIEAKVGEKVYRYTVTVQNYAEIYANQVMDTYISENINSSMTNMEKLEKIAQFPCQYDYSVDSSSAIGMIIRGGGDCWASTDAILELCEKVGFAARAHDGRNDPGAGSGHMNVIVKVDGILYIVEAGYEDTAPRYYSIYQEQEYEYEINSDNETITITCYNGVDKIVNIPEYIDGYQVTELGEESFCYRDEIRTVTIPDSVKKIGDYAFYDTGIQTIKIPEGVTEIGNKAFVSIFDYEGPMGSFGFNESLEIVEIPASVTTLGLDLSEAVVLYHGTKAQWDSINFTSAYEAPETDKMFYSTNGIELSETKAELLPGQTQTINIYSIDENVSISSNNSKIANVKLENEIREYEFYRDGSNANVVNTIKTLTVTALKSGSTVLTVKNGEVSTEILVTVGKKGTKVEVGEYKYVLTSSKEVAFNGLINNKITKVTIPKTIKIGNKTYKVTSISNNALKKTKVTSVSIGNNVKVIGNAAFESCSKLTKVTIGSGVTKIGSNTFKNCKKLKQITIKSTKLKTVGKNSFKGIKADAKIKVPGKKLSSYKKLLKKKGQGSKVKIVK